MTSLKNLRFQREGGAAAGRGWGWGVGGGAVGGVGDEGVGEMDRTT